MSLRRQTIPVGAMSRFSKSIICAGLMLTSCGLLSACSSHEREAFKQPEVYTVAGRQLPPPPAYDRVKLVHLADMLPSKELPQSSSSTSLSPSYYIELKNTTVEAATKQIADSLRYSSYCASTVARKKVTLRAIGDGDVMAKILAEKADVSVIVDHENREVRTLDKNLVVPTAPAPQFTP